MGPFFLALFVFIPLVEIGLFISIGGFFGVWPTLCVVILTAIIGIKILKIQGLKTFEEVQSKLSAGHFPMDGVFGVFCLIISGILLITPGFLTDFIGFLLFTRTFRDLFKAAIVNTIIFQNNKPQNDLNPSANAENTTYSKTIDGEFEEIREKSTRKTSSNYKVD